MEILLLFCATILLGYFNGANDNFKGVATLLGSGTANYRRTLAFATGTTFLGSLAAASLAAELAKRFSGSDLVSAGLAASAPFQASVAFGATLTILAATCLGLPVSTTHALTGGLLGAASGLSAVTNPAVLISGFLAPLLVSPLLAFAMAVVIYPVFRYVRLRTGVDKETCVCVGSTVVQIVPMPAAAESVFSLPSIDITVAPQHACIQRYRGQVLGISLQRALDGAHYLSAGAVGFARGLNDTPKIAALLLSANLLGLSNANLLVGLAIALGALLNARRVAVTLSYRITGMNHGQGFTANLITSALVIFASRWGLPVSTTHVSCGALFGIGLTTRQANHPTIATILLAWIFTLPAAALFSFLAVKLLARL